jgi:D-3-phosphoglycerate dehydrogenase
MAERFGVLVLNQISTNGLKRLPAERYAVVKDHAAPDAVLLRSADLHAIGIAPSVLAIARAGAGTNNIPVGAMSERGVPVFNAPGASRTARRPSRAAKSPARRWASSASAGSAAWWPTRPSSSA